MEEPVAAFRSVKLQGIRFHGHDIDHVLHRRTFATAVHRSEIMSVQVHRVAHHRIIIQDDTQVLAFVDQYLIGF